MMRWFKKVLEVVLSLLLLIFLTIVLLLRWPTESGQIINSNFAARGSFAKIPKMKVEVFETAASEAPEGFVVRGASLLKKKRMVYPAILVTHPKGSFLIEAGLGTAGPKEIQEGPWIFRTINHFQLGKPLSAQRPDLTKELKPDFALVTHVHWDHLSGLLDFPDVPIRMLAADKAFALGQAHPSLHGINSDQMQNLQARIQTLTLPDVPYENFPQSLDLFGDQSVVLVGLPGHTPGSMGIFLNISSAKRFLIVGDAIYSVDAKGEPEARPLLTELFSDQDRAQARITRKKLEELIAHSNEITLVPMHDPSALEKLGKAAGSDS